MIQCMGIFMFSLFRFPISKAQYNFRMQVQQPEPFGQTEPNENEIFYEQLERQQQNEATEYSKLKLRDLFPINFISEKEAFFSQKQQYNPHFLYKTIVYPQPIKLSTQYQGLAMKILKNSPPYPTNIPYLNEEEVRKQIQEYLDELGLKDYVQIKMEFQCLSRTSVSFFKNKIVLKIRTPLSYTKINLQGVLNHEVGTHIIRSLNHKENCVRKPSEKGKIIQEGLAAINQLLPESQPFLFKPALRYLAAIYASKYTFIEVFQRLNKFVPDKDQCWRECVRVKRGMGNTEQKGGYYKDQSYLIGAIDILRNRKTIDFEKIYFGKLSPEQTRNLQSGVLPHFLDTPDKMRVYKKKLEKIALCNFIDSLDVEE